MRITLATDAPGSGWGASVHLTETVTTSDYRTEEENCFYIATKGALALHKTLTAVSGSLANKWVDA